MQSSFTENEDEHLTQTVTTTDRFRMMTIATRNEKLYKNAKGNEVGKDEEGAMGGWRFCAWQALTGRRGSPALPFSA